MNSLCFSQEKGLGNFDISPDDSSIVFSYLIGNQSGLFLMNRDGTGLKQLVVSEKDQYLIYPKFLSDGRTIVFMSSAGYEKKCSVLMFDTREGKLELLFTLNEIITEISLSEDKTAIFYCKASEFKANSPIGVAAPHGMDVFSFDLKTRMHTQLSFLYAYSLSRVSEFNKETLLLRLEAGPESGMVFLSKKDGRTTSRIVPMNNPRKLPRVYYSPMISNRFNVFLFRAPNEIYIMSLNDFIAKSVYFRPPDSIRNMCLFHSERKIMFTTDDGDENLHIISYEGTGLETLKIDIETF